MAFLRYRRKSNTCTVTCWNFDADMKKTIRFYLCGEPLIEGGRLCAKHEADRIRLSR